MLRMKTGYPQSPERDQQKRYVLCCQLKAILGSWHSTTELLPHSGIQPHYSTSICTCVLRLDHFQQGPAGQRGGIVVQEHDAGGFGEWRVRTDRLAIERHLLQNLPVGGVAGIEPGAFAQQFRRPSRARAGNWPAWRASASRFANSSICRASKSSPVQVAYCLCAASNRAA